MKARDLLAISTGNGSAQSFDAYFKRRPGARKFVEEWLAMRVSGETDWSTAVVLRHLRETRHCPLKAVTAFQRWLQENYPKQYRSVSR